MNTKKILFSAIILAFFLGALPVFAAPPAEGAFIPIVRCEVSGNSAYANDPCDLCQVFGIVARVIKLILYYIIPPMAVVAFLMAGIFFLFGGGNPNQITKGRQILWVTILGILIAYAGWLMVNTVINQLINPDEWKWWQVWYKVPTCVSEGVPEAPAPIITISQPPTTTYSGEFSDEEARLFLKANGITVNKANCADVYTSVNCTSLDGIPRSTINRLIYIKENCPQCNVEVTGGTEVAPHKSHAPGKPIVDLGADYQIIKFIDKNIDSLGVAKICTAPEDYQYRYRCDTDESTRHFHIEFVY